MTQTRQLAAIMFTDIVGYTAMMGKDEQKAMELLKVNRDIQKSLIEEYNGKWLKEMGDGTLASFPSASEAVYCAIKIQEALADNTNLNLRIGIHVGEIVLENGDVFGDGVNIASRLEQLATSGSIWISESVNSNIQNKHGIETRFIREEQLKNVQEPLRVYEVNINGMGVETTHATNTHRSSQKSSALKVVFIVSLALIVLYSLVYFLYLSTEEVIEPPTIAVLAFDDESPGGELEYLGDGIAGEIINLLAPIEGLQVIGKTSSFSFKGKSATIGEIGETLNAGIIVDGSVSTYEKNKRISVQLIDASSGAQIWSKNYDREEDDLYTIIDGTAQSIASSLLNKLSLEDIESARQHDPEALEYYFKGRFFEEKYVLTVDDSLLFDQSEQMYLRAIAIDSAYVDAYAGLAELYTAKIDKSTIEVVDAEYERKSDSLITIGYRLNPNSAGILSVKGYRYFDNNDSAFFYLKKAFEIDPDNNNNNISIAILYNYLGLYENSISFYNHVLASDPLNIFARISLARNMEKFERFDEARVAYLKILEIEPDNISANDGLCLMAILTDKDKGEAERWLEKVQKVHPEYPGQALVLALNGEAEAALEQLESVMVFSLLNMKKEALERIEEGCLESDYHGYWSYLSLKNARETAFIKNEQAFIEILAKAKMIHEERVKKYSRIFDN